MIVIFVSGLVIGVFLAYMPAKSILYSLKYVSIFVTVNFQVFQSPAKRRWSFEKRRLCFL